MRRLGIYVGVALISASVLALQVIFTRIFSIMGGLTGYPFFAGALDDVRISSSARYTVNFTPPASLPAPDANTLAQWAFNEGSGQTIVDTSGNGRNGVLGASTAAGSDDPTWIAANR